jgi:hypothetical protein
MKKSATGRCSRRRVKSMVAGGFVATPGSGHRDERGGD